VKIDATDAAVDLSELADLWEDLNAARDRGTARHWNEREQTPEQRTAARKRDRQERLDRDEGARLGLPDPPGYTRSPAREDVMDVLADLTPAALELEEEMREYLCEPLDRPDTRPFLTPPRPSSQTDARLTPASYARPRPFFDSDGEPVDGYRPGEWMALGAGQGDVDSRVPEALQWLSRHATRITDADKLEHLCRESRRMIRAARTALGSGERVQRLKQACPICENLSLVAFLDRCPPDYQPCTRRDCDPMQHGLIVCTANSGNPDETPACQCGLEDCPAKCHQGRRHRWPSGDWERLLLVVEEAG
jgi:hypothetical protein